MKLAIMVMAGALTGCAGMVASNDGQRVVIEHDMGIADQRVQQLAVQACEQHGKPSATLVTTANKNPRYKKGFGVQLSTFDCS
jgi:hypothetical protein